MVNRQTQNARTRTTLAVLRHGDTVISYRVVRSARRRKTIEIRVDPSDGVIVTAPTRTSARQIRQLVTARAPWVVNRLVAQQAAAPPQRTLETGDRLPYLGSFRHLSVEEHERGGVVVQSELQEIRISIPSTTAADERRAVVERTLTTWYRGQAQTYFDERLKHWAEVAGYEPKRLLIRAQKRRWGSCSADGTIRINWRLMLASPEIVDSVLVHELAHLRVNNHSAQFWAEVARIFPEFQEARSRLREIGATLSL